MTLLTDIPDPHELTYDQLNGWIEARLEALAQTAFTPEVMQSFAPVELAQGLDGPFGAEADAEWRRFFVATLLADWACYPKAVDRVDYPRLKYIMSSSHRYFRLWCCRLPDGQATPVGYSAAYPIAKFVYDGIRENPEGVDDRGAFLPLRFVKPEDVRYGYGFNISIVPQLRNTGCSQRMVRAFRRDAARFPQVAVMAVTVDEAGRKLSRFTGLSHLGAVTVQGEAEGLFARGAARARPS